MSSALSLTIGADVSGLNANVGQAKAADAIKGANDAMQVFASMGPAWIASHQQIVQGVAAEGIAFAGLSRVMKDTAQTADSVDKGMAAADAGFAAGSAAVDQKILASHQRTLRESIAAYEAEAAAFAAGSAEKIARLQQEQSYVVANYGAQSVEAQHVAKEINDAERQQFDASQKLMIDDTNDFIALKNDQLRAAIAHEDKLVAQHQVSAADALKIENDLTNQIRAQELARLDVEIALLDQGSAAWRKAVDDRVKINQQGDDQITKNADAAADDIAKKQQQTDQMIARSGAQTITSLISGRTTLLGAVTSLAEKGLEHMIQSGIEELLHTVTIETGKTAAVTAGGEAQVAAKTAAAAQGKAVDAAAGAASVMGDAHKAAAGAYSAVAGIPVVGPVLAPIAAGVALAAVSAFDIFSAAGGIDSVPYDGAIFELHKNETVLSAPLSASLKNMALNFEDPSRSMASLDAMAGAFTQGSSGGGDVAGSSGGDTYHFNVSAIDAAGVSRFFQQNAPTLMRQLATQKRNGNANALMR